MSITIVTQHYDKKKNKLSVTFKHYFRVNFVKSVMFFQGKIKSEAINETSGIYKNSLEPMIIKHLSKFQENFKRPIPKIKKKLSKAAKLQMQIEDMEAEHEDQLKSIQKNYETQISQLKEEMSSLESKNNSLNQRFKIMLAVMILLIVTYKLFL